MAIKMSDEIIDYVKIPKDRIAVLIGKKGTTKAKIEKYIGIKLSVDSDDGLVTIIVPPEPKDPLAILKAKNIVKAIGRGFSPKDALFLLEDSYLLEVIDLREYELTKKAMIRQKGRVIGSEGSMKIAIEKFLNVKLAIYGKTISIIGERDNVIAARNMVERILTGTPQSAVMHMLERKRMELLGGEFY